MAYTKEERYLIELYRLTQGTARPVSRLEVGRHAGLSPKAVDNICNGLARANFIKKEREEIFLTARGLQLAQKLL